MQTLQIKLLSTKLTAENSGKENILLFKKKKSGVVEIKLAENKFCSVVEELSSDVTNKYCIIASGDKINVATIVFSYTI